MKKVVLAFSMLLIGAAAYCQPNGILPKLNFGFESVERGMPSGWSTFGGDGYILTIDSTNVHSGKYSAAVEFKSGNPDYKSLAFTIPESYAGKKITFSGYIKTENVTGGYAGLWMRIDPSIAFDNMNKRGITGTTAWTKYEISLDMDPERTKQIVFGGLLVGKGKMWIDDLRVAVDGKDIKDLRPLQRKIFSAEKDKEFDKGSLITAIPADQVATGNLKTLGLIWGFLKYYHPSVAKGEYNWDYELFRILPKVIKAADNRDRDRTLTDWITGLGHFSGGKNAAWKKSDVKFEPDLEWITRSGFSDELTSLLTQIKNSDRPKEHYYVRLMPGIGNPEFKNENAYSSMKYPDAGYRLLALYRYWNVIQYYFPYKNLIEEDWKTVLEEFIPRVVNAKDETEYTLNILELIGRIHDTHANIWGSNPALNNYFGLNYAPLELKFIENRPVVTGYYNEKFGKETGLKPGDIITEVNNKPVADAVKEKLKFSPASNYPTKLRDIAVSLLRTNDSVINITFVRNGKSENKTLKTFSVRDINLYRKYQVRDTCFRIINWDIAYINNGSLKKRHLPGIWNDLKNTKGLIIDNRNYPSDFPIYDLCRYLMPESTPFVRFTNGSIENPGLFTFHKELKTGYRNRDYYKGKVVILVNEISQSSSEFHAMAYRVNPNATVIGSTTAGADGDVSQFLLPGGISTMISGIGVYYPDGKETQRMGILPDVEVKPSIKGVAEGRDEVMEKAIDLINSSKKKS